MRLFPSSGKEWFGLFLLPFKVFVPAGYIMVVIEREKLGYRMDTGEIVPFVLGGYVISFFVLVSGAMIQYWTGPQKAYLSTCGFVAVMFFFGFLLLPYLAHI